MGFVEVSNISSSQQVSGSGQIPLSEGCYEYIVPGQRNARLAFEQLTLLVTRALLQPLAMGPSAMGLRATTPPTLT